MLLYSFITSVIVSSEMLECGVAEVDGLSRTTIVWQVFGRQNIYVVLPGLLDVLMLYHTLTGLPSSIY